MTRLLRWPTRSSAATYRLRPLRVGLRSRFSGESPVTSVFGVSVVSDYYDAHPHRVPRVPISLTGFPGSGHDGVATTLAALTGLSFASVARRVEHSVGASTRVILSRFGEEYFRALESNELETALGETPAGVLSVRDGVLLDPRDFERLLTRSALVHVYVGIDALFERVHARLHDDPNSLLPDLAGPVDVERFAAILAEREVCLEEATIRVDATHRNTHEVAREIIGHFSLWEETL